MCTVGRSRWTASLAALCLVALPAPADSLAQAPAGGAERTASGSRPQPPPVVLYSSPIPPPLDAPLAAAERGLAEGPPAPAGLAAYVNEPFYAPLAARLERNDLRDEIAIRIGRYRTAKLGLLNELRARLDLVRDEDPLVREAKLGEFAREQTPRIASLEAEGEDIRRGLCEDGEGRTDYFRWRLAHAGIQNASKQSYDRVVLSFLHADLYYREGLSPGQRRLLSEVILNLTDSLDPDQAPKGDVFLFAPETSRIVFRQPPSPELRSSLVAYQKVKTILKQEIIDLLISTEANPTESAAVASVKALAEAQAVRLAAIESLAEDIRHKLAKENVSDRKDEMAGISADLQARIAAYRNDKLELEKALLTQVEAAKNALHTGTAAAGEEATRQAIAKFTRENADRYAALDKRRGEIRAELSQVGSSGSAPVSMDAMVANFSASLKKLVPYWDYRDYRNAVIQTGLSPEQRRLLFDGALQKLALPLPRGEPLFGTP